MLPIYPSFISPKAKYDKKTVIILSVFVIAAIGLFLAASFLPPLAAAMIALSFLITPIAVGLGFLIKSSIANRLKNNRIKDNLKLSRNKLELAIDKLESAIDKLESVKHRLDSSVDDKLKSHRDILESCKKRLESVEKKLGSISPTGPKTHTAAAVATEGSSSSPSSSWGVSICENLRVFSKMFTFPTPFSSCFRKGG